MKYRKGDFVGYYDIKLLAIMKIINGINKYNGFGYNIECIYSKDNEWNVGEKYSIVQANNKYFSKFFSIKKLTKEEVIPYIL